MKKQKSQRVTHMFSKIFNLRLWFDWARIKSFTDSLKEAVRRIFVLQKRTTLEQQTNEQMEKEFNEAVAKMNLTPEDLLKKQKSLFRLSLIMLFVAFLILIYAGLQIVGGSIKATLVSLVVMCIALSLSFRYHFWYFQIKHRKLGATFNEWYKEGLLGEQNE